MSVHAAQVVAACGALESPAPLLRSGIGGPAVGQYRRLHPTTATVGYYDEEPPTRTTPPDTASRH